MRAAFSAVRDQTRGRAIATGQRALFCALFCALLCVLLLASEPFRFPPARGALLHVVSAFAVAHDVASFGLPRAIPKLFRAADAGVRDGYRSVRKVIE